MKILLTTFCATYSHTPLALYALRAYCLSQGQRLDIEAFTTTQPDDAVLEKICTHFPGEDSVLGFSCYCWNIEKTLRIASAVRKLLPKIFIVFGGPEMAEEFDKYLLNGDADAVIPGEGELPLSALINCLRGGRPLSEVKGVYFLKGSGPFGKPFAKLETASDSLNGSAVEAAVSDAIIGEPSRQKLSPERIPFSYENGLAGHENKILYYEASRGCPMSCGYCLSHNDRPVRLKPAETVRKELRVFIDAKVPRLKFTDRTFNAVRSFAMDVWEFLMENDNGETCFHFEIAAGLLDGEMLALLSRARPGLFQFEIGVQSANTDVLSLIKRPAKLPRLFENAAKLKAFDNIHLHLDLIAGLPGENYRSFVKTFNSVYALEPHQLQLGFLKLLKGTPLRRDAEKLGIIFADHPPYEVLYTADISYGELRELKTVENMTELFHNSGKFVNTLRYVMKFFDSAYEFFKRLGDFWNENGYGDKPHGKILLYEVFFKFCETVRNEISLSCVQDLLRFDLLINENERNVPGWLTPTLTEDQKRLAREIKKSLADKQTRPASPGEEIKTPPKFPHSLRLEFFQMDLLPYLKGERDTPEQRDTAVLFRYPVFGRQSIFKILERVGNFKKD